VRKCILLDFDGTITNKDTTKILLLELLKAKPWRFLLLTHLILQVLYSKNSSTLQNCKNRMIGHLISGQNLCQLQSALKRYNEKVNLLYRPVLLEKIKEAEINGDLVIVVTASPCFAVSYCMANLPVTVIGTKFKKCGTFYSGNLDGKNCYGEEKVKNIERFINDASFHVNVIEAWSDHFSDYPMMRMAKQRYWIGDSRLNQQVNEKDPDGNFIFSH
jgi:phosphatidylglycerophosphatase C